MQRHTRRFTAAAVFAGIAVLATGCASTAAGGAAPSTEAVTTTERIAVTYPNGIAVLDGTTLETVKEFETEKFTRVNPFGDGRTIAVTTSQGFQMLDTAKPALTDLTIPATTAGHVVAHDGKTLLYDDGTGGTTILDTGAFAGGYASAPTGDRHKAASAHHGVSIALKDGTLLTTVGDKTARTGAEALRAKGGGWEQTAVNAQCPGIHGEGTAQGDAAVFGCEDGALLYKDGAFTKFAAPAAYGRMGNAFVSPTSPIVVGDYKKDRDAEGYLLNAVTLIDTAASTYRVVDLPAAVQYTFRDVARGPGDFAYILATDGSIHVLDPSSGEIARSFPVVEPWKGPVEWQDPHPAIKIRGDVAYVTEPAANSVHVVDLASGKILTTARLKHTPNEIAVASD
ncbi:MAG: hypothetical protein LBE60_06535 [Microbacterium sp.]|jgi:hypothetical protein|uniref:zinc metallochaperone AztD n=1 Tax=Microbacterium sp. TaxID=51671 RepID=UPI00281B2A92|nr:zinc metallochaperone AztD [Microbacterium sp.]MDR2321288.1 hypothetical protein [Microbacterium sp.]